MSKPAAATSRLASPAEGRSKDFRPPEPLGVLAALPHPLLVLGEDNRILYANSPAETFFQTSLAVLRRQRLDDIVAFGSPLVALVGQVRRSSATVNEYGIDVARPRAETQRLIDVFAGPLPDEHDRVLVMLHQRSMAQMIERQVTHRHAARTVSGMAAVLAHEIKNPLSGIRGAAQLLEANLSPDDQELARLICSETDRIRDLVDRMEVFGDERPLSLEPLNIHAVLDHVKRLAGTGFAKGLRILEDYDPSLPPVSGNRDKLVQAFLNLVKNAAEAIIQGGGTGLGQITLSTAFRPGVRLTLPGSETRVSLPLMISVEDDGPGIPDDFKPYLFEPFLTTKRNGSGLGLALVAKIIRDHGGVIECESRPGRTLFRILFPLEERRPKKDDATGEPQKGQP